MKITKELLINISLSFATILLFNIRQISIYDEPEMRVHWGICLFCLSPFFALVFLLINNNHFRSIPDTPLLPTNGLVQSKRLQVLIFVTITISYMLFSSLAVTISKAACLLGFPFGTIVGFVIIVIARHLSAQGNDLKMKSPGAICFFLACGWTATAWALGIFLGTFVALSAQMWKAVWLIQPIRWVGFWGLEFLVAWTNVVLGYWIYRFIFKERLMGRLYNSGIRVPFLTVWMVWISLSLLILFDRKNYKNMVSVAAVSPAKTEISEALRLSKEAVNFGAGLVVWPEAWLRDINRENCLYQVSEHIAPITIPGAWGEGIVFVIGCGGIEDNSNIAFLIDNGQVTGEYGKNHPVWVLGERSDIRNGMPIFDVKLKTTRSDFAEIRLGIQICYDMDFPADSFALAEEGADIIVQPSWDWAGVRTHYGVSIFRATENFAPVVKADKGFDSAIIDSDGWVLGKTENKKLVEEVIVEKVRIPQKGNKFRINPHWVGRMCFLVTFVFIFSENNFLTRTRKFFRV